ncbi:hypothetical protein [Marispirochaeta aestuarii]|nr:hypothetical protein [Marispirochaeta aestuarii]
MEKEQRLSRLQETALHQEDFLYTLNLIKQELRLIEMQLPDNTKKICRYRTRFCTDTVLQDVLAHVLNVLEDYPDAREEMLSRLERLISTPH